MPTPLKEHLSAIPVAAPTDAICVGARVRGREAARARGRTLFDEAELRLPPHPPLDRAADRAS